MVDFGLGSRNRVRKIDARTGIFKVMNGDDEITFKKIRMEMDLPNLETGWCAFVKERGLVFTEGVKSPKPEAVDGNEFKLGVRVDVFSEDMPEDLDEPIGLREIASTAIAVRRAFKDLYKQYEDQREANPGCAPVVDVQSFKKISMRNGPSYGPIFEIVGWTDRRSEFDGDEPDPPPKKSDAKVDDLDDGDALDEVLAAAKEPAI